MHPDPMSAVPTCTTPGSELPESRLDFVKRSWNVPPQPPTAFLKMPVYPWFLENALFQSEGRTLPVPDVGGRGLWGRKQSI